MENIKQTRLLEIFFRSLRGENISVKELAAQYNVSTKSVSRDINDLKLFFADHYFYLIAFRMDKGTEHPYYFRVDRIRRITEHRDKIFTEKLYFDEGLLRERSLYMWPGKLRTIRFEFDGPSVQAVLDKLPTAKIIDRREGKYVIEAEVYGDGIKMWLLSQSSWLKVIAPKDFVAEMQETVKKMAELYGLT